MSFYHKKDILRKKRYKPRQWPLPFVGVFLLILQFNTKKYRETQLLPLKLIQKAVSQGWSESLVYFVWMKRKNIFYNYTARSAARLLNIHQSTLIKHVKILQDKGLVFFSGGNLCTTGINKLVKSLGGPVIKVKYTTKSKSDQHDHIKFFILKNNLKKQGYAYHKKSKIIETQGEKSQLLSKLRKQKQRADNRYTISNDSLGKLYKRSAVTGARLQKKFRDKKLIRTRAFFKLIRENVSRMEFNMRYRFGKFALFGSNLYQRISNTFFIRGSKAPKVLTKWKEGFNVFRVVKWAFDRELDKLVAEGKLPGRPSYCSIPDIKPRMSK